MYLTIDEIKTLHLEFTSLCNAKCPQCPRTNNDSLPLESLSLADIQTMFPVSFVSQLNHMYSCGNYGDPAVHPECIDICKYFIDNGCGSVRIFTNGGIRTPEFWKELARIGVSVVFAIDGLEDTNHIYRDGVKWDKLMANVNAFISEGGKARWAYLIFEHNEHQIEEARALSEKLGFETFVEKASSRYRMGSDPTKSVSSGKNRDGIEIKESDASAKYKKSTDVIITKHGSWKKYTQETEITCKTKKENNLFVSFDGNVWPCCWIGSSMHFSGQSPTRESMKVYSSTMNSLKHHTLEEILNNKWFSHDLEKSWEINNSDRLHVCTRTCGKLFDPT